MMEMGGQIEDETAAGLLPVDNAGLLGIIKDEESCADSDFSVDEKDIATAAVMAGEDIPTQGASAMLLSAAAKDSGASRQHKSDKA